MIAMVIAPYHYIIPCNLFVKTVIAKDTKITKEHATLSTAFFLSENMSYKDALSINESCYYYAKTKVDTQYEITCSGEHKINLVLLSSTGKRLAFEKKVQGNTTIIFLKDTPKNIGSNCFLQIQNRTSKNIYLQVKTKLIPKPTPSINQNKKSTSKASSEQTRTKTKKSPINIPEQKNTDKHLSQNTPLSEKPKKKKLSTKKNIFVNLNPHFLLLRESNVHKLTLFKNKKRIHFNTFICISTNPDVATMKHGTVTAKKKGITVLYLKDKKSTAATSCVIRVY